MPTPNTAIWLALKSRITTLVTAPTMTVYDPDATITTPAPYVLTSDIRNEPVRLGIGGERGMHNISGTLMLAIHYPITLPATHVQLVEMGGKIAEHFPADLCMKYGDTKLRVTAEPDVAQPYRQDDMRVCVVRVLWSSV